MTSRIIGVPYQNRRYRGIHPSGHQESHAVFDLGVVDSDISNDGISDYGRDKSEEHNDSTKLEAIGDNSNSYGNY